jgi:hypothetical protein
MNRNKLMLLALLGCVGTAFAAQAQVYKWTDANGVVHFTDTPPPQSTANVQTIQVTGDLPHATPAANGASVDLPKNANVDNPPEATDVADTAENRAKACQTARNNLELLQSKFTVTIPSAYGKTQELDEKDRADQITRANAQITLYCQ